jgi:hypothetical protein
VLVISLANGKRKQIAHADSLKWREGYLVCFDPAGRALASFDPDEVRSFEVVDDLTDEIPTSREPRHLRWLKTLRRQKDPSPVPHGRVERLVARIKRQREGLGDDPLPLSLLTFGDEDSDINEWIRAASDKIRAAADKQEEDELTSMDVVEPLTAGPPPSIDKQSNEELVRLLTDSSASERDFDEGSVERPQDSGQARENT